MIMLNDILDLSKSEIENTKIRFNQSHNDFLPVELFTSKNQELYDRHFGNYTKNKSFKEGQIVIGFIRLSEETWLLFDISLIKKDLDKFSISAYEYETISKYEKYFGRLIIKFKNKSQNLIRKAVSVIDECEVSEIISETFESGDFPGYENIDVSWKTLRKLIDKNDWKTALENQKGVYLITDISTGKRYVGSAYGENMIYGRWKSYIKTCHGGNKELKNLDREYIKENFHFSILDIYKSTTEDKIIINREQHWMKILLSKDKRFGYNN